MENTEIYTPMEKVLIEAAKWLETKQNMNKALELDLMLLELEAKADMMDGKQLGEWLL